MIDSSSVLVVSTHKFGSHSKKGDLKTLNDAILGNFFKNRIKKVAKQDCTYVVADISKYNGNKKDLSIGIKDAMFFRNGEPINKAVKTVVLIKDGKVVKLIRNQIKKGLFKDLQYLIQKER